MACRDASWVEMIAVMPSDRTTLCSRAMIVAPVSASSWPVGSSAISRRGALAAADGEGHVAHRVHLAGRRAVGAPELLDHDDLITGGPAREHGREGGLDGHRGCPSWPCVWAGSPGLCRGRRTCPD